MPYRFGDLIVVPFPFTDQTTTGDIPGLTVENWV
jgi:hypothetical protein